MPPPPPPPAPPQRQRPTTSEEGEGKEELARRFLNAQYLRRQAAEQANGRTNGSTRSYADRRCWICFQDVGAVVYDRHDLCLECAESVLRYVLMPLLAPSLVDVDASIDAAVTEAEQRIAASPMASPLSPEFQPPRMSGWTCWHCKAIQSDASQQCQCCRQPRPADPVCCRCDSNVLQVKTCSVTRRPHTTWPCDRCKLENTDEAVECRGCHNHRMWYCASCSLENTWSHRACDACGGEHKLDNLSSVVNRDFLNQLGLGSDAQSLHKEQQKKVEQIKEHTLRLDHRVNQLDLLPIPIDDDGNCLFRALSYQLVRTDVFYPVVRHMIVDYMEAHRAEYALLIGGDEYDSYVSGMRRNSIWGDELCVHAASRVFRVNINVITSEEHRWHLRYEFATSGASPAKFAVAAGAACCRRLFLCYRSPDHYFCVVNPTREPRVRIIDLDASLRAWGGAAPLPNGNSQPNTAVSTPQRGSTQQQQPPAIPPRFSPPTTQEFRPLPAGASAATKAPSHQMTLTRHASDSPPPLRRGGPPPASPPTVSAVAKPALPSTRSNTSTHHSEHKQQQQQQQQPQLPPARTRLPAGSSAPSPSSTTSASVDEMIRPMTRSTLNEVLQVSHFALLKAPIMVRLCVASSLMNIDVTVQDVVKQDREGAYFYLYPIQHRMIIEGGEHRFPWGPIYRQTLKACEAVRRSGGQTQSSSRQLMPLFLLQHIRTGGFICPGDDLTIKQVFPDLEPVHCADLFCRKTGDLASCLLTIDDHFTESRSKLYIKFFRNELKSPFVSFIGDRPLFCCELPVTGSMLVVHQLFSGQPERLCLRCNQWYDGSHRAWSLRENAKQSPGGCEHFSQVEETMEQISRY